MGGILPTVFRECIEGCDKRVHRLFRFLAAAVEFGTFVDYIPAGYEIVVKFLIDNVVRFSAIPCELERPQYVFGFTIDECVYLCLLIPGWQA